MEHALDNTQLALSNGFRVKYLSMLIWNSAIREEVGGQVGRIFH